VTITFPDRTPRVIFSVTKELTHGLGSYNINAGPKGRGRSKKTWSECVRQDLQSLNLKAEWAQDRTKRKGLFGGNHPTRASMEKWMLNG